MITTKHGRARFKQRLQIKNQYEMERKTQLAIERGTLIHNGSSKPRTLCFCFEGYKYIVSENKNTLITVFRANPRPTASKRRLIEDIRVQESMMEIRFFDCEC